MPTKTCAFCDGPLYINAPHHCPLAQPTTPPVPAPVDVEALSNMYSVLRRRGHSPYCDKFHCVEHKGQFYPDPRTFCTCEQEETLARAKEAITGLRASLAGCPHGKRTSPDDGCWDCDDAARGAPVDAALLAQCREALEAAEVELATRTTMKRALGQVRAALLAITSSSA